MKSHVPKIYKFFSDDFKLPWLFEEKMKKILRISPEKIWKFLHV